MRPKSPFMVCEGEVIKGVRGVKQRGKRGGQGRGKRGEEVKVVMEGGRGVRSEQVRGKGEGGQRGKEHIWMKRDDLKNAQ